MSLGKPYNPHPEGNNVSEVKRVKITRARCTYRIGDEFDVKEFRDGYGSSYSYNWWRVVGTDGGLVHKSDCEVIEEGEEDNEIYKKGSITHVGLNTYVISCMGCDKAKALPSASKNKARRNFKRNRWEKHNGSYYCLDCCNLTEQELKKNTGADYLRMKWQHAKSKVKKQSQKERDLFAEYRQVRGEIIRQRPKEKKMWAVNECGMGIIDSIKEICSLSSSLHMIDVDRLLTLLLEEIEPIEREQTDF